jgi:hypothetical protein
MASAASATESSQIDRIAKYGKYFDPPPGATIRFDEVEVRNYGEAQPYKIRGYIKVSPPKGHCFRIQRREDLPDEVVCQSKSVSWNAHDILPGGIVRWTVRFSDEDPGGDFDWPTPHRIGQVIPPGERLPELSKPVLLMDCQVEVGTRSRRIHLPLASGRKWTIQFPLKDVLAPNQKPEPNLYYQERQGLGGVTENSTNDMERKYSFDATKARAFANRKEAVTLYWTLPERGTFVMNASNFISSDSPAGSVGSCRYRTAQQLDEEKGFIECHLTADFDVVYLPLHCLPDLLSTSN